MVVKLIQRWKATGSYEPKPPGGYRGHKLTGHQGFVEKMLREKPDITLMEIKKRLEGIKERRLKWKRNQTALDPKRPVFIDETGASTKMARR